MTTPRALVLRTAGTNCDAETVHALAKAGARTDIIHLHAIMERPQRVRDYGLIVFPGGFTYGDDIASGVVFAVEMRERVLPEVLRVVSDGGLVLGICNGMQILVRAGLLPGGDGRVSASMAPNVSGKFECRWVRLEAVTDRSPFLEKGQVVECPVAHAEGRFVPLDDALLEAMEADGRVALRYTAPDGGPASYPDNPNGSPNAIAGIIDPTGRILGLMPHPERNVEPWNHPRWTRGPSPQHGAGLAVFLNALRHLRGA